MQNDIPALIKEAIDKESTIEITYNKPDEVPSIRTISDVQYSTEYANSIIAYCHLRNELRTFRIDRISRVAFVKDVPECVSESAIPTPTTQTNNEETYRFNPNKRVFNLYGIDYNS